MASMTPETTFAQRVQRAKELLKTVRHAALATVNTDGSPHNSPVFSTWDGGLNFYWASGQDTQHSQNIARDPRVFAVIFDSLGQGGGLYLQGTAQPLEGEELTAALKVVNSTRATWQRPPVQAGHYSGTSPQRLYKATRTHTWVNMTERNEQGLVVREYRKPITPQDLLQ
jgi:hypothetical protein